MLNERVGWFRYWPAFDVPAPRKEAVQAVQKQIRVELPGLERRTGWVPHAVAYEVVRENG